MRDAALLELGEECAHLECEAVGPARARAARAAVDELLRHAPRRAVQSAAPPALDEGELRLDGLLVRVRVRVRANPNPNPNPEP